MGEVYRARDTRLGRDVAMKILPESFARDTDRLRRFEQEARSVAALNHPNILAVFDIGQHEGSPFLVSELLEGESLTSRSWTVARLPQRKTIEYGVQIAQGLAAAHEKGIVHRDLKPENIFVTRDGRIKILDFGLAKLAQTVGADPDEVTLTGSHTAAGVVMGTASYMAPEQVRGAGSRSSHRYFRVWRVAVRDALRRARLPPRYSGGNHDRGPERRSAGVVGSRASMVSPALERIVRTLPGEESRPALPIGARSVIRAERAFGNRGQRRGTGRGCTPACSLLLWAAVALALAAVAAVTWWVARRPAPTTRMQFAIAVPEEMSVSHLALSRDGSDAGVCFARRKHRLPMLYRAAHRLSQRDGSGWHPGRNLSFLVAGWRLGRVFCQRQTAKNASFGWSPQVLANVLAARGGSWGSRDVIIYSPGPQQRHLAG